jgi:hypothetical protein
MLEVDRGTLCSNGAGRRLQNLDDLQARQAAGDRSGVSTKAVEEVFGFRMQRLLGGQVRGPHIAGTIADPQLMGNFREPFTVIPLSYTLIFSVGSKSSYIIILRLPPMNVCHLDRRQPIDDDLGDAATTKE